MNRRRVLLLLALAALASVGAWWFVRGDRDRAAGPEIATARPDKSGHYERPDKSGHYGPDDEEAHDEPADVVQSHPAVRDWATEAKLRVVHRERVDELPQPVAVFETVFWEPRDTTSLRARISGSSEVKGKTVLEIGTGSGLLSLCCLNAGASKVVATDVNPAALANALYNAANMGFADRLELRRVPLDKAGAFSVIGDSEKFDFIISNPPWEEGTPDKIDGYAYYDPGFRLLQSLLAGLDDHLEPGGKALLAYGAGEAIKTILRLAPQHALDAKVLDQQNLDALPDVFLPGMLLEVKRKSGS